ncbi:hypothetical protein [Nocardia abscessus]|uniref:hypothetical protein n=1 Tax=Nocardia abscessus TaxID=120957 RepID=UPI002457D737|nr:hypothetical protein [Nocardia abscessus]
MAGVPAALGWVAKDGRDPGENDDRGGAGQFRFAVADGAATSARPEVWAEILVHAFVGRGLDPFDPLVLPELRRQWRSEVHQRELPWYARAKLEEGGAAAFVGLELDIANHRYRCVAVGDSCLLHLRGADLLVAGPIDDWEQFDRFPRLIHTTDNDSFRAALWRTEGPYQSGDVFILASDALAKYLLRCHRLDHRIDFAMGHADSEERFADWVIHARLHDELDNDDTTVCVVRP